MEQISTCRAAYLIPFIEVLRELGAPVERELARAKLPVLLEEIPDERISNVLAGQFAERCKHREGIDDLGWLAAKRYSTSTFSEDLLTVLRFSPTVKSRLDRFANLAALESTEVRVGIAQSDASVEVFCDYTAPDDLTGLSNFDWTQAMVLVEIVRSVMGKTWCPDAFNFQSRFSVCDDARQTYPNTVFTTGAKHSSITFPSNVLSKCAASCLPSSSLEMFEAPRKFVLDPCGQVLRPYLREGTPKLELLAEIMRTSSRTLQRKLQKEGFSYSQLLEKTRFEMAVEMLQESDNQLIEIAMDLGYENQSNFSRSFKRISGMTPGAYRHQVFEQGQFANSVAL